MFPVKQVRWRIPVFAMAVVGFVFGLLVLAAALLILLSENLASVLTSGDKRSSYSKHKAHQEQKSQFVHMHPKRWIFEVTSDMDGAIMRPDGPILALS